MRKILKRIFRRFGYELHPQGVLPMNVRQMYNFIKLEHLFERVQQVDGSVVECGVGLGRTFLMLSFLIEREGKKRMFWGFDSFEGFPEPSPEDASPRNPKAGEWSGTSPDDIRMVLRRGGLNPEMIASRIKLIPGFFEQSLATYDGKPIAFLHIDVDLYQSYVTVLNTLVPFVADGGLVLLDEYGSDRWPGATKAVDEFLADKPWKLELHAESGKYYFFKSA